MRLCPWSLALASKGLSSERLSLAWPRIFFCVLGLGLEPYVLDSTSENHVSIAWIPVHAGVHGNEVADYLAKSGSKSKMHGPEPFITVPYASCVNTVKDWSTDRWKSVWNKHKDCLKTKESGSWTYSRLAIRLLNLKRPQLNKSSSSSNWALQCTAAQKNCSSC